MSLPVTSEPYILITDQDLNYIGDPISGIQSADVTQNFNVPDSGSFTVPAYPEYMSSLLRGNRAMLIRDGEIFSAGPIERPGGYEWGVGGDNASDESEPGLITINFTDDSLHPASRLVFPDPAKAASDATQPAYYTATGNAETLMRALVNLNAGPGARTERRVSKLILGSVAGVGSSVVVKSRFEKLGDVLRALASSGGGLGYEVVQIGNDLVFRVFAPSDKTKVARFSRGLGNLRSVKYDVEAPTGTFAIVGGSGEEDARTIITRANTSSTDNWWLTEFWVEASSQDAGTGLEQAGDEALSQSDEKVTLTTITIDTEDIKYGRDFRTGDLVTVEVLPGIEVVDTVRSAHYTYTPDDGEAVSVLIGSQEATSDPAWIQLTQDMSARLGRLERR